MLLEHGRRLTPETDPDLDWTEQDTERRPDILAYHRLGAAVELAGKRMEVIVFVREKHDGTFHYDLGVKGNSPKGGGAVPRPFREPAVPQARTGQVGIPEFKVGTGTNLNIAIRDENSNAPRYSVVSQFEF